jgi:recombination protein RecA
MAKKPTKLELSPLAQRLAAQAKIMQKFNSTPKESYVVDGRPTGLPVLDNEVFGVGGLPKGKIIEIYGKESSGKTAVAMYMAGMVQKQDPNAVVKIYDAEHAWTDAWGNSMGLDLTKYEVPQSDGSIIKMRRTQIPPFKSAEHMADQIHADLAIAPPDIIIIDSLAVLQPQQVLEKNVSEYTMNDNMARARFLTSFFNSLLGGFTYPPGDKNAPEVSVDSTGTTVICINHAKLKNKRVNGKDVQEWVTVGGVSSDFCAAVRLMVRRKSFEKTGPTITHQLLTVTADKNKIAPPKKSCEIRLSFSGGMEQVGSLDYLQMALDKRLVEVGAGGWVTSSLLPGGRIQGRENFNALVASDENMRLMIMTATNIL